MYTQNFSRKANSAKMTTYVSDLCRLCLKKSEFKFSLFTGNILDKIQSLTSIKIEEDDELPKICCEACVANVYTSYKFQQCVIESDKTLREAFCQNDSQIIELAPEVFEVLHLEETPDKINSADTIKLLKFKSENSEAGDNCNYVEYNCKIEDIEVTSEHSSMPSSVGDDQILKNFLENTFNSVEDGSNNSDDFNNGSNLEYVDVGNFMDSVTINNSNTVDNIFHDIDVKEHDRKEPLTVLIVDTDTTDSGDIDDINELGIKDKKTFNVYSDQRESKIENNSPTPDAQDILAKLGMRRKFLEKFAVYHEKVKVNQAALVCVDCDMKFDSKRMLQRHMMRHKIDKCPFCSITMRSDNLKRHIQIHTDSPEICDICGKIAKNKESLRGHINYQHKNSATIKCEPCNRDFKSNHHYKTHVKKIHLGIRNHQCHICGKKFFANHDLNRHINMTHWGVRPYVCQYCKKGFCSPYARKTHIRQHTLETPYRCEICAAGFRQKVSLVTHLKSKHSITDKNKVISDGTM